jgi:hypothetical protein
VGILFRQGVGLGDYSSLIASFPTDPASLQVTDLSWASSVSSIIYPSHGNSLADTDCNMKYIYAGNVDGCTTEKLDGNALIYSWEVLTDSLPIFTLNAGIPTCVLA